MDTRKLIEELQAYLGQRSTMTLATIGEEGAPQSAPLFFVADEKLNLYFVSDVDSQHGHNILQRPEVAVSIYSETFKWQDIKGIQLEGTAQLITDRIDEKRAWSLYKSKFPFVIAFANKVSASNWFIVRPTWIRWIDNQVGFGYKRELSSEDLRR